VAKRLKIGLASASRRVHVALKNGWLVNKSEKTNGKSYDLDIGEPLPDDESGLPRPSEIDDLSTISPNSGGEGGGIVFDDEHLIGSADPWDVEGLA
jgi:hypothetical protein